MCLIAGASQAPMKPFHWQTRKGSYFWGEGDICSLVLLRTQQNLSSGISVQTEESGAGQGFPREASDSSLHLFSPVEKSSPGVWWRCLVTCKPLPAPRVLESLVKSWAWPDAAAHSLPLAAGAGGRMLSPNQGCARYLFGALPMGVCCAFGQRNVSHGAWMVTFITPVPGPCGGWPSWWNDWFGVGISELSS